MLKIRVLIGGQLGLRILVIKEGSLYETTPTDARLEGRPPTDVLDGGCN